MVDVVRLNNKEAVKVGTIVEYEGSFYKITRCIDAAWMFSDDSLSGYNLRLELIKSGE